MGSAAGVSWLDQHPTLAGAAIVLTLICIIRAFMKREDWWQVCLSTLVVAANVLDDDAIGCVIWTIMMSAYWARVVVPAINRLAARTKEVRHG